MKPTVVILLSDKRSGSTMFEKELCTHPGINHVAYTPHSYNETHYWLMAACLLGSSRRLFYGHQHYKNYGSRQRVRRLLIQCVQGNIPDFRIPEDDRKLIFEGWQRLCDTYAHPVFFEKSPQHPHHWAALDLMLKWMELTEVQVRFIALIRNPMAVMYSAQKLFMTEPSERQFGWACAYRNMMTMNELVGGDHFLWVRYEDLTAQPKQVFERVLNFIGLGPCDTIGDHVHSSSLCKWHDDRHFILKLDESVVRLARHFGYTDQELYNPAKPAPTFLERASYRVMGSCKRIKSKLYNQIKMI